MKAARYGDDRKRVLFADDDATARLLARSHLEAVGFDMLEARDGSEAVALFASEQVDVVVLDILMPNLDGYAACQRIRQLPKGRFTPILMMTAMEDLDAINRAYEVGASEFTVKPVRWTAEIHRLHNMIKSAEAVAGLQQAENELRAARDEWVRTFDALDDIVMIMDRELRVTRLNAAGRKAFAKVGYDPLGGVCFARFRLHDSCEACRLCPNRECLASGKTETVEMEYHGLGTFRVSASALRNAAGEVQGLVHLACDITAQRQLENQLRQAQKMETIGVLAGGVAHDFNNLMQVINGFVDLLGHEVTGHPASEQYLEEIRRAVVRGRDVTRQLLTFGRKSEPRKALLDLNKELTDLRGLVERTLPKNVQLTFALDPHLIVVEADQSQLSQIVINLSTNAAYAMPNGGKLLIETRPLQADDRFCQEHAGMKPGEYACLTVTDTGQGMDVHIQARAFEPFFTTKPFGQGNGLGLAVVYGIVKSHGGFISCYSEVGHGTAFKIYLPIMRRTLPAPAETVVANSPAGGGETIMVVDDESSLRRLGEAILSRAGYRVVTAPDGETALELLASLQPRPELIVLDLSMPGMGGEGCLTQVTRDYADVKVLVATGFSANLTREKLMALGAVGVIGKPYTVNDILQKIRRVLHPVQAGK